MSNKTFSIEPSPQVLDNSKSLKLNFGGDRFTRVNHALGRFYYNPGKDGEVLNFGPSVTTITSAAMTADWKAQYYGRKGYYPAIETRDSRGHFGTFLHMIFAEYLKRRLVAGNEAFMLKDEVLESFSLWASLVDRGQQWADELEEELSKDVQCMMVWGNRYEVKPVLIEKTVRHPFYNYHGTMDALVEVTIGERNKSGKNVGKLKKDAETHRGLWLADLKSNQGDMKPAEAVQLILLYKALMANNPELKIEGLYRLCGRDFKYNSQSSDYSLKMAEVVVEKRTEINYRKEEKIVMPHPELLNVDHYIPIAQNKLAGVENEPYRATFSRHFGLNDLGMPDVHIKTLKEAIESYQAGEETRALPQVEKAAEAQLGAYLADSTIKLFGKAA